MSYFNYLLSIGIFFLILFAWVISTFILDNMVLSVTLIFSLILQTINILNTKIIRKV